MGCAKRTLSLTPSAALSGQPSFLKQAFVLAGVPALACGARADPHPKGWGSFHVSRGSLRGPSGPPELRNSSRGLTFNTIRHHRTSSDAIAFSLAKVHFEARQGSSPNLSGTSRPVSRILSDGDHPSEARRCRWAPATYPETSREQRSDGFRGQRTGLLGLAPGGVYRAAPVTRRTGGLLHHRFTLTRPLGRAVCSLWHCPAGHPGWVLPTTLLCGVRTFLSPVTRAAITRPTRPGSKSSFPNGLKRHGRTPSCPR